MKNNTTLQKLNIGKMLKEIAQRKNISPQKIANLISLYQKNAGKIFQVNDMDCEDLAKISYLAEYNFLKVISEKHLSHLPIIENSSYSYHMELDEKTGHFKIIGDLRDKDVLNKIHLGQHLKVYANKNGWNEKEMAKRLHCSQSTVSHLYSRKSLTVKKMISLSNLLKHNFIAEVYLSRMFIISSPDKVSRATITKTPQEVRIENPDDNNFVVVFSRQDNQK